MPALLFGEKKVRENREFGDFVNTGNIARTQGKHRENTGNVMGLIPRL